MPDKVDKESARYTPKGTDKEHCSICTHYVNRTTCDKVQGKIEPNGWCRFFKRR